MANLAEEIAKVASDRDAGLIVMGLHSSPLLGPRMGSVHISGAVPGAQAGPRASAGARRRGVTRSSRCRQTRDRAPGAVKKTTTSRSGGSA